MQKAIAGAKSIQHSLGLKKPRLQSKLKHIISKISHCIVVNIDHGFTRRFIDAEIAVQNGFKFNNKDQQVFENAEKMLVTLEKEWKERKELLNGLDKAQISRIKVFTPGN